MRKLRELDSRQVLGILLVVALVSIAISLLVNVTSVHARFAEWLEGWLQNFSTEMLGAAATFWLIDLVVGGREKQREKEEALVEKQAAEAKAGRELKEQFIRELRSSVNDVAIRAAEGLRAHGWLQDGSLKELNLGNVNLQGANLLSANLQGARLRSSNLQGVDFSFANLQGADFRFANLQRVNLFGTNLQEVDLSGVNLQEASLLNAKLRWAQLWGADLQGAYLLSANLQGANLREANLQGADLRDANLQEAYLRNADLQLAKLDNAKFDEKTTLPDEGYWTPETDMTRFTDPNHPNFWRSHNPGSPGY